MSLDKPTPPPTRPAVRRHARDQVYELVEGAPVEWQGLRLRGPDQVAHHGRRGLDGGNLATNRDPLGHRAHIQGEVEG